MRTSSALVTYWAKVVVLLHEPLVNADESDQETIIGYGRLYGLTAAPERVRPLIEAEVADGVIEWSDTTWYEIDPRTLDETIRGRSVPVLGEGVWYRSGRMFFPAEPQ